MKKYISFKIAACMLLVLCVAFACRPIRVSPEPKPIEFVPETRADSAYNQLRETIVFEHMYLSIYEDHQNSNPNLMDYYPPRYIASDDMFGSKLPTAAPIYSTYKAYLSPSGSTPAGVQYAMTFHQDDQDNHKGYFTEEHKNATFEEIEEHAYICIGELFEGNKDNELSYELISSSPVIFLIGGKTAHLFKKGEVSFLVFDDLTTEDFSQEFYNAIRLSPHYDEFLNKSRIEVVFQFTTLN